MAARPAAAAKPQQLLGDLAYESLLELLERERWARDTRLPGEIELSGKLGVSRPMLRQALARLRAEGRIYSRKGSGTYVGEPAPQRAELHYGPLASIPDVRSFLEFRLVIEAECAARAALNHDASARRAIDQRRRQFERAVASGHAGVEQDIAFHGAIAAASGNRYFALTLASLGESMRFAVRLVRDLSARPLAERKAEVCREHAQIAAAIDAGDAEAARAAMTAHLERGIARLFGK